jgi:predicted GNAT family acetyltransferase
MEWNFSEGRIYSNNEKGELITEATYETLENNVINVDHVYVNPEYRGQGIAEKTMLTVVNYIRQHNLKVIATCSYASAWFGKHEEEYTDILVRNQDQVSACRIDGRH